MKFKVKKTERIVKRNIHGDVVSVRREYVIVARRLFRKHLYLRLLPGWQHKLISNEPMGIELTRSYYKATTFNEDVKSVSNVKWARHIVEEINTNPNNFIQE